MSGLDATSKSELWAGFPVYVIASKQEMWTSFFLRDMYTTRLLNTLAASA